jgi:hypothetical protein
VRLASLCGVLSAAPDQGAIDTTSTARAARDKAPGKVGAERSPLPRLVAKIG